MRRDQGRKERGYDQRNTKSLFLDPQTGKQYIQPNIQTKENNVTKLPQQQQGKLEHTNTNPGGCLQVHPFSVPIPRTLVAGQMIFRKLYTSQQ